MKIKNTKECNCGLQSDAGRILIIAGATLELEDSVWAQYAEQASGMIEEGSLVVVEAMKLSDEQKEAEEKSALEAARALIAASKK